jgi:peptidoglycan/LPS O-acetylase OafA/YrhL
MRAHVYPLDVVRFLAAFSVMAFHLAFYDWAAAHSSVTVMLNHAAAYPSLAGWTWFGWVGVEVFFVISGFVIANSANNSSPIRFAKSRVLRLYPAVWVCAFFTLAAWVFIGGGDWQRLAPSLLRSLALWVRGPWIDGVYWSLAVEMAFYAIVFVLLLSGRFARLPWLAWGLLVYSGGFLLTRLAAGEALSAYDLWVTLRVNDDVLMLRFGCFFAIGIWMWLASVRAMRPHDWFGVLAAVACSCVEIYLRTAELAAGEIRAHMVLSPIVPMAIFVVAVAFMFHFALAPERYAPRSPRNQEALKNIGKMTYPLYLTHAVLGAGLIRVLAEAGVDPWLALASSALAMLALSYWVARFAEPELRRVLRTAWDRGEALLQRAPALAFLFRPGGAVANRA